LPGTNALAYLASTSSTKENGFITLTPERLLCLRQEYNTEQLEMDLQRYLLPAHLYTHFGCLFDAF